MASRVRREWARTNHGEPGSLARTTASISAAPVLPSYEGHLRLPTARVVVLQGGHTVCGPPSRMSPCKFSPLD